MAAVAGASSGISPAAGAGIAFGVVGLAQGFFAGQAAESNFKIQQYKLEVDKELAEFNSKMASMSLVEDFNKTMASNAVMAAVQGSQGASAQAVGKANASQLNWDLDYTEFSKDIQMSGIDSDIFAAATAGRMASSTALGKGLMSGLNTGLQAYSVMSKG